jgi:hypothetical protein
VTKPSQTRQSNGCKHVGGLCLIDESKKAGKCVQTCKKCGWIRVHGERFYHPSETPATDQALAPAPFVSLAVTPPPAPPCPIKFKVKP